VGEDRERTFVRAALSQTGSLAALAIALLLLVIAAALVSETITILSAPPWDEYHFVEVSCGSAFEVVTSGVRDDVLAFATGECESVAKRRFWFSSSIALFAAILGAVGVWGLAKSRRGLGGLQTDDAEAISVTST
jgi:hypothetical protein